MAVLTAVTKSEAYAEVKTVLPRAKDMAQKFSDRLLAANYPAMAMLARLNDICTLIDRWATLLAVPGLQAYAADQHESVPGYNILAEITIARNALIVVRDRIINDLPRATQPVGVAGNVAVIMVAADGTQTFMSFTPAQTAPLRTDLAAFISAIS